MFGSLVKYSLDLNRLEGLERSGSNTVKSERVAWNTRRGAPSGLATTLLPNHWASGRCVLFLEEGVASPNRAQRALGRVLEPCLL